jgi:hypothetical protein
MRILSPSMLSPSMLRLATLRLAMFSLATLMGGLVVTAGPASATPLPASCAVAHAGDLSVSPDVATAQDYRLRFSAGAESPSLHAGTLTVKGGDGAGGDARDILDAASVVLLGGLTNHHGAGCSSDYFTSSVSPVVAGLKAGKVYDVTWSALTAVSGATRLSFTALHLHLAGATPGQPVAVTLEIRGAQTNGDTVLASLLPQEARSDFSIPARSLAPLLAATAGRPAHDVAVPVTISALTARHGDMRLDGSGTAILTGSPDAASATGHMSMRNLPELIATLHAAGQTRASTALILANLVGHHADMDTSWDVDWQGGILTVNRIPLPLR